MDADEKRIEDFAANIARANRILLTSIEQKDVMNLYGYDSPAAKWAKLRADYGLVSNQMATEARAKLNAFKMGGPSRQSKYSIDSPMPLQSARSRGFRKRRKHSRESLLLTRRSDGGRTWTRSPCANLHLLWRKYSPA